LNNAKSYLQLREHLIKIGIDPIVIEHLDKMDSSMQEDIILLFTECANDELLLVLGLKDLEFAEKYINSKKKEKLLLQ
jgi:hypothetical protein